MKRFTAIVLFLVFLIPAWAGAGGPKGSAAVSGCIANCAAESQQAEEGFFLPGWDEKNGTRLADGELQLVKGRMIAASLPEAGSLNDSRIVLWDEGNGNGNSAICHGSGQSVTVISR